jgi:hypothetical protein
MPVVKRSPICFLVWTVFSFSPAFGELPEQPALPLDVLAVTGGRPAHGQVSSGRSTYDGRVRITGNRGGAGPRIYVARPENFRKDLFSERRDTDGPRLRINAAGLHASTAVDPIPDHLTFCDPYLATGTRKNPTSCIHNGRPADCYDIDVLQIVHLALPGSPGARSELWSTPVRITVERPKTSRADVAKVALRGPPVLSPITRAPSKSGEILSEPVVSGDGRLLFLNSGDTLLYSVMGEGDTPCVARNWKRLDHVSKMHRDPKMKRYGIARYPIRDSENRRIKAGRPLRGAYPWIDREGRNLFFTQVGGTGLFYRDGENKLQARFKVLNRPRRRDVELEGATRLAMSYFGLWSQGKIIIPDTRVNNTDYHLGRSDYQPRVRLYRDGEAAGVVLGHGTMSKINSAENQWNYRSPLLPRSPRDVVWWLSTNNEMTGEVVFDDALDLGSLIYSPMNAAVENKRLAWRDGFDNRRGTGYVKAPRIQNAAASELRWKLPAFGRLIGARVEPIAAGGIIGKGLWLDGDRSRLEYVIPEQDSGAMDGAVWMTALWLDPRDLSRRRRLLDLPDGSRVDLEAGGLILGDNQGSETPIAFPAALQLRARAWTHLAFISSPVSVDVYVQGFKLASLAGSYLRLRPGQFRIGKPVEETLAGFRGWVDELRVVSGGRDPESVCNLAHGTLRGLDAVDNAADFAHAGNYPRTSHEEIRARLTSAYRPSWERYRCEPFSARTQSCFRTLHHPGGMDSACVREGLLFPEGPLYHDLPRPDSRANLFCQTCHMKRHPTPSLRITSPLGAGEPTAVLSEDARRQPVQAPVRIHGFLPRALLGFNEDIEAPPEGLPLDPLLYPSAHEVLAVD